MHRDRRTDCVKVGLKGGHVMTGHGMGLGGRILPSVIHDILDSASFLADLDSLSARVLSAGKNGISEFLVIDGGDVMSAHGISGSEISWCVSRRGCTALRAFPAGTRLTVYRGLQVSRL